MTGRRNALVVVLTALLVLVLVNSDIYRKERLLAEGRTVLLTLAPVDPRSLMQGDYMRLRYALEADVLAATEGEPPARAGGYLVLALDANGVAQFRRLADDAPLADDEILLRYRIRDGRPRIASGAFFFQEGSAQDYQDARYGELRVADDGAALLTALRDQDFKPMGAASR